MCSSKYGPYAAICIFSRTICSICTTAVCTCVRQCVYVRACTRLLADVYRKYYRLIPGIRVKLLPAIGIRIGRHVHSTVSTTATGHEWENAWRWPCESVNIMYIVVRSAASMRSNWYEYTHKHTHAAHPGSGERMHARIRRRHVCMLERIYRLYEFD